MSELYGDYVTIMDVNCQNVTGCITELIKAMDRGIDIEWETLQVIIRKPNDERGRNPLNMNISVKQECEGNKEQFWTIGVKARGKMKDEG